MAAKSSNLDGWTSGAHLQTEPPHHPYPSRGQKDLEKMGASGSAPSHLPSWSLNRKPSPSCPNTRHCLGIHVTLIKEIGAAPPPPHAWMAPVVEDMLCHGRTGLTEAVVMGPGQAVQFYGRQSLGECLSLGKVRDTTFTLTGVGTWVGKPAYLAADPLTIQGGWWAIIQAITECQIEARGPGQPCSHPLTYQLFRFHCPGDSPWKEWSGDACFDHQPLPQRPQRGWDHDWCWRDQRLIQPQPPSPSPDCGFKIDRSSISTASLVSSQSDRSEGSQHSQCGRWCRRLEPTWRLIYQSLKIRMQRMSSPTRVGGGTWLYIIMWDARTAPSFHTPSSPCKGTLEN